MRPPTQMAMYQVTMQCMADQQMAMQWETAQMTWRWQPTPTRTTNASLLGGVCAMSQSTWR